MSNRIESDLPPPLPEEPPPPFMLYPRAGKKIIADTPPITSIFNSFAPFEEEDTPEPQGWFPTEDVASGDEDIDDFGYEETPQSIREERFQRSLRNPAMVAYQNSRRCPPELAIMVPNNSSSRPPHRL